MQEVWEYVTKLPEILNQWGTFSYALLTALVVVGLCLIAVYMFFAPKETRPASLLYGGLLVVVLAGGGFVLKGLGAASQRRAEKAWLEEHRCRSGERRLIVSNLYRLVPEMTRERSAHEFVSMLAAIVGEDLPPSIPAPLVVAIDFSEQPSPWKRGVGTENYRDVLAQLHVYQIMWGDLDEAKGIARTFLGIPPDAAPIDPVVPLKDLPLAGDPRREIQFGDAYHRLLGHVALAVALQTIGDAKAATGDQRKQLFLLASQQLREAQARLVNGRDDPVLKRNLYDRGDELIAQALAESGVKP